LLRPRRERPRHRAGDQRDELAPPHVGHGTFSHAVAPAHAWRAPADSSWDELLLVIEVAPPALPYALMSQG
jgi:hypothetical protein